MADFPSKVNTETSSAHSQGGNGFSGKMANITTMVDMSFLRSIGAILMILEILLGMIHWALIASTNYMETPAYSWVMFVAVTLWILTTVFFILILFSFNRHLRFVPWPLTMLMYNGIGAVLYLTAFLTNAVTVENSYFNQDYLGAAAFFGAVVTVAYGASTFLSYLDWRGHPTTSTVPT